MNKEVESTSIKSSRTSVSKEVMYFRQQWHSMSTTKVILFKMKTENTLDHDDVKVKSEKWLLFADTGIIRCNDILSAIKS